MPKINQAQLCSVLNGKLYGEGKSFVSSISIDSRTITDPSGTCFFALVGERNDGHKYIPDLIRKGVKTFVVSSLSEEQKKLQGVCFIDIEDTLKALQNLARWNREQYRYPVVGITGSNGKTIVKEWLYELLHQKLSIVRNPKSYNSQIGVPLSVWLMEKNYELAIFEAGISKPGEMQKLAEIIRPTVSIFTNIGEAHQENFSSIEEKITQKLDLFELAEAIIYCSDHRLSANRIEKRFQQKKLIGWSFTDSSASVFIETEKTHDGTAFELSFHDKKYICTLPLSDPASIENAAHCLVFAASQDLLSEEVLESVKNLKPVAMRLEMKDGINQCKLINDYYNSDINSLAIALNFQSQQNVLSVKKKSLILSDIQQSGQQLQSLYQKVNRLLVANEIDRLIGIGTDISAHKNCFSAETEFYESTDAFLQNFSPSSFKEEIILLKGARQFHFERISSALQKKYHQTILEINLNRLVDNLNFYKSQLRPETKIMVMVKAFSYGSGTSEIARVLQFQQVDYLAVAVADEGIELRRAGIELPIVVMNPEEHSFESMIEFRLEPNIYSLDLCRRFAAAVARNAVSNYPVHIKLETGMNRLGFSSETDIRELAQMLSASRQLRVASIFSHLAGSDEEKHDEFTHLQAEQFQKRASLITEKLDYKVLRHLLNSAGIERFAGFQFEMVRLGIGLYGVSANQSKVIQTIGCLKTTVSQVKQVPAGETVGYGRRGKVMHESEIAVLPIGYADGYDRRLGNGIGHVFVRGQFAPVIGTVCMDMCMIDVTGLNVQEGDEVEIIGDHVKLTDVARWMGTIPYEVLTSISQRVKRVYLQE
ncbi:MAG: hypothetical protein A2W90_13650 [Bacteroidetes bacterium GWF2_42_66]|nr:MAG: hypothetical protein A2W92_14365 [Bacteroidetes bacterium GWA2_42_15]OFX97303.1 MAG: hypothetical protein A2W89_00825 [Bacteroidetes bacterium GWE2_42_39]OFY39940.1 MAG: hypothetical protein A2W90_13650 [Bacteroidetes bacterium GWF2_42_66]HBL78126.1 bifunctional UDP-N-acetylmuramoyl-tripeptide:D-alanyl-D-alanine ligase/alanine racemase [Prolixibacteraceae bacterium]HCR91884.1 bifunctional UDP-N-acetylmuramoyl-tripeptide:D-alanyl-D-alanine ligase/alanine racemase [Prolixibacteraceae bact